MTNRAGVKVFHCLLYVLAQALNVPFPEIREAALDVKLAD